MLTCNYLVEDLDLPLVGCLDSTQMPAGAVISSVGQPSTPVRIFGDKRIVVVASEMKVLPEMTRDLIQIICALARKIKSRMLYCVEGVPVEKVEKIERNEMNFLTTSADFSKKLLDMGHKPLHDAVVSGITGGIISQAAMCGSDPFELTAILAPTSSFYPDAWSSVMIIRCIDQLETEWESNTAKLETSASELESKVKDLMRSNLKRSGSYNSMYA